MEKQLLEIARNNVKCITKLHFLDGLSDEELTIEEIGDGNLNYVTRIIGKEDRVILKHAPPHIKILGPSFPLTVARLDIEYKALCEYNKLYEGSVPVPYGFDRKCNTVFMEDLHDFEILRKQLVKGHVDTAAILKLAEVIGVVHKNTHVGTLNEEDFKSLDEAFRNVEMIGLTENFIFTNPIIIGQETNNVAKEILPKLPELLANPNIYTNVQKLKALFLKKKECLVHGDLHTGSIMVKNGIPKMIDSEFAYVGPAAFDVGMFLANCIASYHQHILTPEDNENHRKIAFQMLQICHDFVTTYLQHMTAYTGDRNEYFTNLMSEIAGFCGIELVRRTIGVAHLEDLSHSPSCELEALESGLRLVQAFENIHDVDKLLNVCLMLS